MVHHHPSRTVLRVQPDPGVLGEASSWTTKHSTLFNFNTFFFVEAVIDIIIDCAILILPLQAIHGLVITARTKVLLYSIFLLGGL